MAVEAVPLDDCLDDVFAGEHPVRLRDTDRRVKPSQHRVRVLPGEVRWLVAVAELSPSGCGEADSVELGLPLRFEGAPVGGCLLLGPGGSGGDGAGGGGVEAEFVGQRGDFGSAVENVAIWFRVTPSMLARPRSTGCHATPRVSERWRRVTAPATYAAVLA